MLFLLNNDIIDIKAPEAHLARRWKSLGCGEPNALRARDALEFVKAVIEHHRRDGLDPDIELATDLAALLITKTGANAALFMPRTEGESEPRLTTVPESVLEIMSTGSKRNQAKEAESIWKTAA